MKIDRLKADPRMSQVVCHNNTAYLAGQVAMGAKGAGVTEQTRDILARIDVLLAEAGTNKGRLLTATIWLVDMATFSEMNAVWDEWVVFGETPARATVCSPQLASQDFKVEISVTAAMA